MAFARREGGLTVGGVGYLAAASDEGRFFRQLTVSGTGASKNAAPPPAPEAASQE